MRPEVESHASTWALVALCGGAGLAGLSVSVTGPILVDIAQGYGVSVAVAGQLMTVASLAGMFGTLGLSPLLDRVGRRRSISITLAGVSLSALACSVAPSFIVLSLAYCLVGLGGFTLLALVLAAVGDLYQKPELGRAMGWVVAGNVGFMVVFLPLMAVIAEWLGWRFTFLVLAGLALVVAGGVRRALPAGVRTRSQEGRRYHSALGGILRSRSVAMLLVTVALTHAAMYGGRTYLGAFAIEHLGATTGEVGPMFSARSLGIAVAGVLAGRFLQATDWRVTASAALMLGATAVAIYALPRDLLCLGAIVVMHGLAIGTLDVGLNSLLASVEGGGGGRGVLMAYRSVMDSLGGILGPALSGAVMAGSGYLAVGWVLGLLAFGAVVSTAVGAKSEAHQPVSSEVQGVR